MADQNEVGTVLQGFRDNRGERHRPELGIDEPHLMTGVEQRAADRQQAKRRQVIVGHAAADGGVWRIDQDDFHGGPREGWSVHAGSRAGRRRGRVQQFAGSFSAETRMRITA